MATQELKLPVARLNSGETGVVKGFAENPLTKQRWATFLPDNEKPYIPAEGLPALKKEDGSPETDVHMYLLVAEGLVTLTGETRSYQVQG